MSISLTERAAAHIKSCVGENAILKITVAVDGCSGMLYCATVVDKIEDSDHVYESYGITVIADHHSIPFIDGTLVDYDKGAFAEGFTYNNPNETGSCGCGKSFTTGE